MPTVPQYDSPTVGLQELPTVRQQTPNRMLLGATIGPEQQVRLGNAVQSFGTGVHQAAAAEADAQTMGAIQGILYGTPDNPTSGYLNQKGKNAVDTYQDTVKSLQNLAPSQAQNLSGEASGLAQTSTNMRVQSALAQITQHNAQQIGVYQQAAGATRIKAAADGAALSFNPVVDKPELNYDTKANEASSPYELNLRTVNAEANSLADLQGIRDPDLRAEFIKDQMGKTYVSVISHMVDGIGKGAKNANGATIQMAQGYFDAVKDNIPLEQRDKIQSVLKAGAMQDTVLSYSDSLMDSKKGENAQFAQIRKDFEAGKISGAEREQIESRISHLNSRAREADNQNTANVVGQAQDFFIKNPGMTMTDLPPTLYAALEHKGQLAALDGFSRREANHTDMGTLQTVQSHFGDGSDNDITKMNDADFLSMHGKLSDKDWKYWNTQRDNSKKGIVSSRTDPGSVAEGVFNGALKSRLVQVGIDPSRMKNPDDKARLGGLQQFAKEWVIQDQTAAGHKFNDDQIGKSLDRLMSTNVEFRTSFMGIDTGNGSKQLVKMDYGSLPKDAKEGIRNALIKRGNANPTNQDVLNYYWRLHGQN